MLILKLSLTMGITKASGLTNKKTVENYLASGVRWPTLFGISLLMLKEREDISEYIGICFRHFWQAWFFVQHCPVVMTLYIIQIFTS